MGVLPIRETAGADAVTIGLAVAEGEKWCCAAACVKVHGASQCTAAVVEVRAHRLSRIPDRAHPIRTPWHCPSDVCVTDDHTARHWPFRTRTPHRHPTPRHRRALLAARPDVSLAACDGGGEGRSQWQWWQWWSAAADGKDKSRQRHSAWGYQGQCVTNRLRCARWAGSAHQNARTAPVHLTRSIVGVVCVALGRCVHRIGGSKHVKLSLLEAVQHTTSHIVSHARAWKLVCLSIC